MVTRKPLACKSLANDEAMIPFPSEDATPPVIKIYFVFITGYKVTISLSNLKQFFEGIIEWPPEAEQIHNHDVAGCG